MSNPCSYTSNIISKIRIFLFIFDINPRASVSKLESQSENKILVHECIINFRRLKNLRIFYILILKFFTTIKLNLDTKNYVMNTD